MYEPLRKKYIPTEIKKVKKEKKRGLFGDTNLPGHSRAQPIKRGGPSMEADPTQDRSEPNSDRFRLHQNRQCKKPNPRSKFSPPFPPPRATCPHRWCLSSSSSASSLLSLPHQCRRSHSVVGHLSLPAAHLPSPLPIGNAAFPPQLPLPPTSALPPTTVDPFPPRRGAATFPLLARSGLRLTGSSLGRR